MLGTIVNSLAIAIGCLVGLVIKKGIPDRVSKTIMSGLALCVIYIGIEGSLKGENTLITVVCIAVGGLIGEIIDIDNKINKLGDFLQNKLSKDKDSETSIAKGFVTTSLIYLCRCYGNSRSTRKRSNRESSNSFYKGTIRRDFSNYIYNYTWYWSNIFICCSISISRLDNYRSFNFSYST